jgi:DDE superfamily endonuclease
MTREVLKAAQCKHAC